MSARLSRRRASGATDRPCQFPQMTLTDSLPAPRRTTSAYIAAIAIGQLMSALERIRPLPSFGFIRTRESGTTCFTLLPARIAVEQTSTMIAKFKLGS